MQQASVLSTALCGVMRICVYACMHVYKWTCTHMGMHTKKRQEKSVIYVFYQQRSDINFLREKTGGLSSQSDSVVFTAWEYMDAYQQQER